jgi:putrescine transport system substrate-binding protein
MSGALAAIVFVAANAFAAPPSPFTPPAAPAAKVVRLLAPEGAIDPKTLEDYERLTGYAVAYDAYDDPRHIAQKWRDGPYDVVILPGPALASAIARGALRPIPHGGIANAKLVAAAIAIKLAAYDPSGTYAIGWGWSAAGILYDAGKVNARLGGPPDSWSVALTPQGVRRLVDCGVALPDRRDDLFVAAWRLIGIDPSLLRDPQVKAAGDALIRARGAVGLFGVRDIVSTMANGGACLAIGDPAEAEFATARSKLGGAALDIRFAAVKEGAPMTIQSLAMPRDAPQPSQGAALIDYLLSPSVAARNAQASGFKSAEEAPPPERVKTLWPSGAFDTHFAPLIEKEWARVRASK